MAAFGTTECYAALKLVATTPDIAWLARKIGGDRVEVKSLARATDDYHFLDARPDYVLAVNRADIVCRAGADLEVGWLPKILEKAANPKVMPGAAGDCDLSRAVTVREKPRGPVDRSMGDVHPAGNPHFWLSPLEMAKGAREVEERLVAADPAHRGEFAANRAKVESELRSLHEKIKSMLKPLVGKAVIEYHRDFHYFIHDYGLNGAGSIEEIPGVSPSAGRLGRVAAEAKKNGTALALASVHDPKSPLAKFEELSGVKVITLGTSLTDYTEGEAYAKWQVSLAEKILAGMK
jgi:zinc/manganese transport system substrate-binding protein